MVPTLVENPNSNLLTCINWWTYAFLIILPQLYPLSSQKPLHFVSNPLHCNMPKGNFQAEVMLNSEKIKSIDHTLRQLLSQSVENSIK